MLKAQIQSSSRLKTENIFQNQELISEESWVQRMPLFLKKYQKRDFKAKLSQKTIVIVNA